MIVCRPFFVCVYSLVFFYQCFLNIEVTDGHHVIFENIGQMAGAISYQHVKLTLNLSSIVAQHNLVHTQLTELLQNFVSNPPGILYEKNSWIKRGHSNAIQILRLQLIDSEEFRKDLSSLYMSLPVPQNGLDDIELRQRRSIAKILKFTKKAIPVIRFANKVLQVTKFGTSAVSLPFGIFGTFMGLYTTGQVNKLRRELYDVVAAHNRLVEVVQTHDKEIVELQQNVDDIKAYLTYSTELDIAHTSAKISRLRNQLISRYHVAVHVIQQLQHRRLAVDFLTGEQIQRMFIQLNVQAEANACTLLVRQHSDLFQLETSYFFDGSDIYILLHVPMVPSDSMLRLFKLHPFPLPFSKKHALMPVAPDDILALSSGFNRYSVQLSTSDLMGCHVINNVYLCERHGVLNTNLNNSCLGSLYQQDLNAVRHWCTLQIHESGELVYQLLNNWYLAYSVEAQTAPISCTNGTQSELHLSKGIVKFYLSPGCRMHLKQHLVISDISIKLDSDLLHFEWRWDDVTLNDLDPERINEDLKFLEDNGIRRPTYSDLQELQLHQRRAPGWWATIVSFVGVATLTVLFIIVFVYFAYRARLYYLAQRDFSENEPDHELDIPPPMYPHVPNANS